MSTNEQLFPTPKTTTKQHHTPNPILTQKIWDNYLQTHHHDTRKKPQLTEERIKLIEKAVKNHGIAATINAIKGCSLSAWHMGHNPNHRKYNTIELILRNTEKIETFSTIQENNETGGGFLDPF